MKKLLLSALLAPWALWAVELKVDCARPGSWKIDTVKVASGDLEEYEFRLASPMPAVPPRTSWTAAAGRRRAIRTIRTARSAARRPSRRGRRNKSN